MATKKVVASLFLLFIHSSKTESQVEVGETNRRQPRLSGPIGKVILQLNHLHPTRSVTANYSLQESNDIKTFVIQDTRQESGIHGFKYEREDPFQFILELKTRFDIIDKATNLTVRHSGLISHVITESSVKSSLDRVTAELVNYTCFPGISQGNPENVLLEIPRSCHVEDSNSRLITVQLEIPDEIMFNYIPQIYRDCIWWGRESVFYGNHEWQCILPKKRWHFPLTFRWLDFSVGYLYFSVRDIIETSINLYVSTAHSLTVLVDLGFGVRTLESAHICSTYDNCINYFRCHKGNVSTPDTKHAVVENNEFLKIYDKCRERQPSCFEKVMNRYHSMKLLKTLRECRIECYSDFVDYNSWTECPINTPLERVKVVLDADNFAKSVIMVPSGTELVALRCPEIEMDLDNVTSEDQLFSAVKWQKMNETLSEDRKTQFYYLSVHGKLHSWLMVDPRKLRENSTAFYCVAPKMDIKHSFLIKKISYFEVKCRPSINGNPTTFENASRIRVVDYEGSGHLIVQLKCNCLNWMPAKCFPRIQMFVNGRKQLRYPKGVKIVPGLGDGQKYYDIIFDIHNESTILGGFYTFSIETSWRSLHTIVLLEFLVVDAGNLAYTSADNTDYTFISIIPPNSFLHEQVKKGSVKATPRTTTAFIESFGRAHEPMFSGQPYYEQYSGYYHY